MKSYSIHPLVYSVIIGTFFSRLATSMSMPFLAIYLTSVKQIEPAITGLIIGVSALVGVITGFIGGHLSDRYGRKVIMLSSLSIWIFVFCGFAYAESIMAFFIFNALNGACKSFFEPSARALMSDFTSKENKLKVFNMRYTAVNIGVVIGPILGLQLGKSSLTIPFLVTAGMFLLYGISLVVMFSKYNIKKENSINKTAAAPMSFQQSLHLITKDRILMFALIGMICGVIGYSQFDSTLPQYLSSTEFFVNGITIFGYMVSLNAVTVIILQYPLLQIGKRYSALTSMACGVIFIGISLFGMMFISQIWSLILCTIIFTAGEILIFTMTDYFVDEIAPPDQKGLYFGTLSFTSIGSVIGPSMGGFLLSFLTNNSYTFIIMGFITLTGCYFIWRAHHLLSLKTKRTTEMIKRHV